MPTPPVEVEGLTKYYGDVRGAEDVTFAVERGEVFGFLGPNGAGKTTVIRILLGLLSPDSGSARILGYDVTDREELLAAKRRVGYIPGDVAFYERVTGARLLDYFGRMKGQQRRAELLERFPVPEDRPVGDYSSGNRQKLAIVQAFMHDPDLVVMDEPTAGLDPLVQREFNALVDEERERGVTLFLSSHILGEVRQVCDRVGVIRDGRMVAIEDVQTLLEKSGTVVRAKFAESVPAAALQFDGVVEATKDEAGYHRLVFAGDFDGLIERLGEYSVADLEVREASLSDVFMHFYGGPVEEGGELEEGDLKDDEEPREGREPRDEGEPEGDGAASGRAGDPTGEPPTDAGSGAVRTSEEG